MSAGSKRIDETFIKRYGLSELLSERVAGPEMSSDLIREKLQDTWKMIDWERLQTKISKKELEETIGCIEKYRDSLVTFGSRGGGFVRREKTVGLHRSLFINNEGKIYVNIKVSDLKPSSEVGSGSFKRITYAIVYREYGLWAFASTKIMDNFNFSSKQVVPKADAIRVCRSEAAVGAVLRGAPYVAQYHEIFYYRNKGVNKLGLYMPYYNSGTIEEIPNKKIERSILKDLFIKTLKGLGEIHKRGVIHRDIKFDNILLHEESDIEGKRIVPYIIDFGLASNIDDREALESTFGTPLFVAPEVWKLHFGDAVEKEKMIKIISCKVDIYALGIIFGSLWFDMQPTFNFSTDTANDNYRFWREPETKPSMEHLVWSMTRDDPSLRPSSKEAKKVLRGLI